VTGGASRACRQICRVPGIGRYLLAIGVLGMLATLTGCGVPVASNPAAIAHRNVPFGLLETPAASTPSTTTSPPPTADDHAVQIYLVKSTGHLAPVGRVVPDPVSLASVVQALIGGPTTAEASAGLQDEVPTQTRVLGPGTIVNGVATVDLSVAFGQLAGQAQIEAIAQVVFSVTADIPDVTAVAFEVAGQLTQVPESNGALVNPATRVDYASLAPT